MRNFAVFPGFGEKIKKWKEKRNKIVQLTKGKVI